MSPIPEDKPIPFAPPPNPQEMSGGAPNIGWASPAAQVAGIADHFLQGAMVGKYMGEQRMQHQAVNQIGQSRASMEIALTAYNNLLQRGIKAPDPKSDPSSWSQDQQNLMKARDAAEFARNTHADLMANYVAPQKKSGVRGALSSVAQGFTAQKPVFTSDQAIQAFRQIPLDALASHMTPVQQAQQGAQLAEAGAQTARATASTTDTQRVQDLQTKGMAASENYRKANAMPAGPERDKAIASAQDDMQVINYQLNLHGQQPVKIPTAGEPQVAQAATDVQGKVLTQKQQQLQRFDQAMTQMQSGKSPLELSTDQQAALDQEIPGFADKWRQGAGPYLAAVKQGPNDTNPAHKFNSPWEATQSFMQDQRRAMLLGRYAPPYVQMLDSAREELTTALQDPKNVEFYQKKYPEFSQVIQQLQPGQTPPPALVDRITDERFRSTPEERAAGKQGRLEQMPPVQLYKMGGEILDNVAGKNSDWARFVTKSGTDKDGMYSTMRPLSDRSMYKTMEFDSTTRQKFSEFQQSLLQAARAQYGLSDQEIGRILPELKPLIGQAGMTPPPGGAPQAGMPPPPTESGVRRYAVTVNGQTQFRSWTQQQYDNAKKSAPQGATITPQ